MEATLGMALTQRMADLGHTFRDVEPALGASPGTVNKWANDRSTPDATHIEALMAYLDVDLNTLGGLILRSELRRSEAHIRLSEGQ